MRPIMTLGLAPFILAGCSAPPEGTAREAVASAPAPAPHGRVVSTFTGSFDAASGALSITYDPSHLTADVAPPPASGSGPTATEGSGGVVMHTSGTVVYGGACGASSLCGPVEAINHFASEATFYSYIDVIVGTGVTSNGPWTYTNVANGATSAAQTWTFSNATANFYFRGHVEAAFASCMALHAALPSLGNGLYEINPGGTTIPAYCDMVYDDGQGGGAGGWTLIEETSASSPPSSLSAGTPQPGTPAYMNQTSWVALTAISTQVHFRSPGSPPTLYVTSKIGVTSPITNLHNLVVANSTAGGNASEDANWIGTMNNAAAVGDTNRLDSSCGTASNGFPSVYWACGNGNGFHIVTTISKWDFSESANEALETWVR